MKSVRVSLLMSDTLIFSALDFYSLTPGWGVKDSLLEPPFNIFLKKYG